MITEYPAPASATEMARPMPCDPPGTSATLLIAVASSRRSLAQERLDLLAVGAETEEDPLVDQHGGHGEPPRQPERFLAGAGIASDVAHLHGSPARLEESERGLTVGDAFHREEENFFHDPPTIPSLSAVRSTAALTLSGASASIRPLHMTTRRRSS